MTKRPSLDSLERLGWRFGLESITALLAELGGPHLSLHYVHVAGSNGKGSTCAFMASFLKYQGFKTGLYTSPHLCDIRERFRINGAWIPQKDFDRLSKLILGACQRVERELGHSPTHFEALTAIAFCWFKEQKVDWAVLEVGLGGRLDATNVIPTPALSLITPITLEHQDILGKTIEKIASEKAGILKPGGVAATVQDHREAASVIDKIARTKGAKLWLGGRDFVFRKKKDGFYWEGPGLRKSFRLPGLAEYQVTNAALAVAGIQALRSEGLSGSDPLIQRSLATARWPGRLEIVRREPLVVLDGAHNPGAAVRLKSHLNSRFPGKKWVVLNGFLKDKDHRGVLTLLSPLTAYAVATEPANDRARDGMEIFRAWKKTGVPCGLRKDWEGALELSLWMAESKGLPLLITGSLYLVGDCRRKLVGFKGLDRI